MTNHDRPKAIYKIGQEVWHLNNRGEAAPFTIDKIAYSHEFNCYIYGDGKRIMAFQDDIFLSFEELQQMVYGLC